MNINCFNGQIRQNGLKKVNLSMIRKVVLEVLVGTRMGKKGL